MSHDFRSPLTAIRLIAQSFELERVEPAERAALSKRLVANALRLEELVENVLAAAQLHAGRLHAQLESLDLGEELARTLGQRRDWFAQRGVALERSIAGGVRVRADRTLLQSVVGNLLDNAVKYSADAPHVMASVTSERGKATLAVADRGEGFDPSLAPRLFERFHRGDGESDVSRPGLGLGLYLVRELARLQGATVRAHSDGPGRGARFEIEFPCERVEASSSSVRARPGATP